MRKKGTAPVPPPPPPQASAKSSPPKKNETPIVARKVLLVDIEQSGEKLFDMGRLDGSMVVLEGSSGTFQSTPIRTDGHKGKCRFDQPIPVGNYNLKFDVFKLNTPITIPNMIQPTITMKMDLSKAISLSFH